MSCRRAGTQGTRGEGVQQQLIVMTTPSMCSVLPLCARLLSDTQVLQAPTALEAVTRDAVGKPCRVQRRQLQFYKPRGYLLRWPVEWPKVGQTMSFSPFCSQNAHPFECTFLYNGSLKSVFAPNLMELASSRKPLMVSKVAFSSLDHPQELAGLARKLSIPLYR